jgi:hypothetical protein
MNTAAPRSWKMEVEVDGSWSTNACRYATEQEAKDAGVELLGRWFVPTDSRAVPSDDPVNYEFKDGRSRSLAAAH